jgi:cell volume regulation protein A
MLGEYVGIGVVAALVFMFVIRPIVVFSSLLPWMVQKKSLLTWREALFLSFIRETGAIPAVLILTVVATGIESAEFVFAIGMWVILLTLTIEPPLTPLLARRLEVAK